MTIISTCERCDEPKVPVEYHEPSDEWLCADCIESLAEAAWERQQERDMESPPETMRETQLRTWEEKRKLK